MTNTNYRHVFYTAQCIYIRTSSFLYNLARKYFFYNPINKCSPGSLKKNIFIFSSCGHTTFLKLLPKHAQNFKILLKNILYHWDTWDNASHFEFVKTKGQVIQNECWFLNDGQKDQMIPNRDFSMSRCSNEGQDPRDTVLYKCSHIGQLLHHAT